MAKLGAKDSLLQLVEDDDARSAAEAAAMATQAGGEVILNAIQRNAGRLRPIA